MVIVGSLGQRQTPNVTEQILRHARATAMAEAFAHYYAAFSKTDFAVVAKSVQTPMLMLNGQHDGGVSEKFVRARAFRRCMRSRRSSSAELRALPDARDIGVARYAGRGICRAPMAWRHKQRTQRSKSACSTSTAGWSTCTGA
jgi:hypothetical protein